MPMGSPGLPLAPGAAPDPPMLGHPGLHPHTLPSHQAGPQQLTPAPGPAGIPIGGAPRPPASDVTRRRFYLHLLPCYQIREMDAQLLTLQRRKRELLARKENRGLSKSESEPPALSQCTLQQPCQQSPQPTGGCNGSGGTALPWRPTHTRLTAHRAPRRGAPARRLQARCQPRVQGPAGSTPDQGRPVTLTGGLRGSRAPACH